MAPSSLPDLDPGFSVCPACHHRTALQYFKQIGKRDLCVVCASEVERADVKKAQARQMRNDDAAFTRKVIGLFLTGCAVLALILFALHYWLTHKKIEPAPVGEAAPLTLKAPSTVAAAAPPASVTINLRGDVLFDPGKAIIQPAAESALSELATAITRVPNGKILILGYTDNKGSAEANDILSQRRAESVKTWLVKKKGIEEKSVSTKGLGEHDPVAPNTNADGSDNPEGRQKNRRVSVIISR